MTKHVESLIPIFKIIVAVLCFTATAPAGWVGLPHLDLFEQLELSLGFVPATDHVQFELCVLVA